MEDCCLRRARFFPPQIPLCKRQSRDIETETDDVLVVHQVHSTSLSTIQSGSTSATVTTASSSASLGDTCRLIELTTSDNGSTNSLASDREVSVEEFVGDGVFSGNWTNHGFIFNSHLLKKTKNRSEFYWLIFGELKGLQVMKSS